jgi:5-oxoprolinase (ATP-hydrolysing)
MALLVEKMHRVDSMSGYEKSKISNPEESNKQLNGQKSEEDTSVYEERRINLGGKNTAAMRASE